MVQPNLILNNSNLEKVVGSVMHLSNCVKSLSILVPSDETSRCSEFKKKQLYHSLLGDNNDITKLKASDIASNFLQFSSGSIESHLGVINVRDIGCHFEHLKDGDEVSVLDLHRDEPTTSNHKRRWCSECPSSVHNKPDFKAGVINPFSCWRRGHSSAKLGFLHISEISAFGNDISIQLKSIYTSKELQANSYSESREINIEVGEKIPGNATSMVCVVILNTDRTKETNRTSEIKGILRSQLLVSRHLDVNSVNSNDQTKTGKNKVPEFVEDLLNKLHNKWKYGGPSSDSKGIIGFALVNNGNRYVESSTFKNILENFAFTNKIWYGSYNLGELALNVKDHLNISHLTLSENSSALCIILDPLIDLGGISVE